MAVEQGRIALEGAVGATGRVMPGARFDAVLLLGVLMYLPASAPVIRELATRVAADPLAEAKALAAEIAGKSPDAVRAAKRLLNRSGTVPIEQQFADERREIGALIGSPNQVEAVMAGFEKRDPSFTDPS